MKLFDPEQYSACNILTCAGVHGNVRLRSYQFFQMRLGVPRRAGRIGKRVRIPRGRATVKIVANERRCKSQETCPNAVCSLRTPRAWVFRPPQGIVFLEKIPSPACRFRVAER